MTDGIHIAPSTFARDIFYVCDGTRRIGRGYVIDPADIKRLVEAFAAAANAAELRRALHEAHLALQCHPYGDTRDEPDIEHAATLLEGTA